MSETIDFLRPRLVGARFEGHSIPLEVLKDFSVLEDLVVEVAKWHYRQENPSRKRIPKGFADQVSLKVSSIEDGSAIPRIVLSISSTASFLFPVDCRDYFERAKESIVTAVDLAERREPITGLTDAHLAYFDRFGRSLMDNESIELNYPETDRPARINRDTRRFLTLSATTAQGFTEEVNIRGRVVEADLEKSRFCLRLNDGNRIESPIQVEHLDVILEALREHQSGTKVFVEGIGKFDRRNRLVELVSVEHMNILDAMDVSARIDEFRILRDGWFEGKGKAFTSASLDWLTQQFESYIPDDLPLPFLYPTGDGGVQAEWSILGTEITLDIDLQKKTGFWHVLNMESNLDEAREIPLAEARDWHWVIDQIEHANKGVQK